MARPIIALLTDFGSRDHYAGVIKGVILGIVPDVTIIDVLHDLPAHDVPFAARELEATYKYFPAGTIFLVVVDPGVGTMRRGLAAEVGDWKFVAPDNGVLTGVFRETEPRRVVELTERRYARPTVSRTFEGRDRFAPAAAWLAKGIQLPAFGRSVPDYLMLEVPQAVLSGDTLRGEVVRIDRFGNVVTNLDRATCERLTDGATVQLLVGGRPISRIVSTYADLQPEEVGALFGSTDHLECAAPATSAAARLGVQVGDAVELTRK
ncbi:MAG TPA: SAM-dependent chlorinase/fluorinase [Vicinamibacterales bacterium]|nr:SAM-dependent chlorinase/fluorinase [Vicinamibacterales bacterium]